jgi:hypothetical protein
MNLEEAIPYLRKGCLIYREGNKYNDCLQGDDKHVYASYYMTIYDILADDWEVKKTYSGSNLTTPNCS